MNLRLQLVIDYYVGGLLHALLKPMVILLGRLLHRDHDLGHCSTITIVKMLGGGSLIIAYPSLLAIKNAPNVKRLRLLTSPEVRPFAESLGLFDEIIVVRTHSPVRLVLDSLAAIRKLFLTDAIVDLEIYSRLTTVFSIVTCARNRIGFYTRDSFWRHGLSTHLLFCNTASGIYYFYDQIGALFGGTVPDLGVCRATFRAGIGIEAIGERSSTARIAMAPCCSDLGRERMLRPEEWLLVLRRKLGGQGLSRQVEIQLFGGGHDRAEIEKLCAMIRIEFPGIVLTNYAGKTALIESIRKIAQTDELLCVDSGLLHFARLLGIPTVSFWGPTAPERLLRPWPGACDEIHYHKLPCSPCLHVSDRVPCGGNNICIRLAVNSEYVAEQNPAWVMVDELATRFSRQSAP